MADFKRDLLIYGGINATTGDMLLKGNITSYSGKFIGNGALLTGITETLPATVSADINGNIIGNYANMHNVVGVIGNVGNTRFVGGNVNVSGQINVLGNVVAPFFVGDGSGVANVTAAKITAPGFKAYQTTAQTTTGFRTLYKFDTLTASFDNTFYNNTESNIVVNGMTIPPYAFMTNIAGYYMIGATSRATVTNGENTVVIYKNGSAYANGSDTLIADGTNYSSTVSTLVYLNGSTDFVQAYLFSEIGVVTQPGGISYSWFNGILLNQGTIVK